MFAAKPQPETTTIEDICVKHRAPELMFIFARLNAHLAGKTRRIANPELPGITLYCEKTAVQKLDILVKEGVVVRIESPFERYKHTNYYRIPGKIYVPSSSSLNLQTPLEIKPTTTERGKNSEMIQRQYSTITNPAFLEYAETFSPRQITDLLKEAKDGNKKAGWFYAALKKMTPVHLPGAGTTAVTSSPYLSGEDAAFIES